MRLIIWYHSFAVGVFLSLSNSGAMAQVPSSSPTSAPETQAQEIKNSRWVQPSQVKGSRDAKPADSKAPENKVTWQATCTDSSGKVVTSTEAGYETCLQQVSLDAKRQKNNGVMDDKKQKPEPGVGAGFNFKIGK